MDEKYEYAGNVDIEDVLLALYKRRTETGKRCRTSPYLRRILELHNEGLCPLDISKRIIEESDGKIKNFASYRVKQLLDDMKVKPYENKRVRVVHGYKLLDEKFFRQLIVEAMGTGKGHFETLNDSFHGEVVYADGTKEVITSLYILTKTIDKAYQEYMLNEEDG